MHYASDAPEMPPADNTLLLWRRQAVAALLRILAIVSLPLILIDALQQIRAEQWPMLAWHLSIGVLVGGFAIAPGLSYKLRAGAAVALLLASGLIGLGYYGLFSISYGLALLSVVFAILLLGPQAALLAIIGLGAGYGLIFAGFGNGLFPYPQRFFDNLAEAPVLFNHWLLVLGSAAILAITLGSLLKVVQSSLHTAQTARSELEHLNHALETTAFQHTTELERETLLRSINETLPNAFLYQVIQRADFSYERYTYLSPSMERLFGLTTAEILADPSRMRALLHPDDQPRLERVDREAVQQRVPFDIEVRMHKADGQIGWFHIRSLIAQELDDGRIIWNGLALEISARKQAELALAEQLRYAEALARCSQVLLADGTATNNWVETVQQALETLRVTIGCCRVALRFYRTADEVRAVPIFVIASQDPTAPPHREHPVNLSDVPPAVIERLAEGKWVAGRMAELFPDDNSVRHHLEVNARNSLLFMGIHVAGLWRGYLAASDSDPDWIWSESQVAFFRTGLDMIAAFMQQWETTATLRTRESLLFESQVRQESLLQAIPDLLLGVDAQGTIRFAHTPPEAPLALPTTVIGRPFVAVLPQPISSVLAAALAQPTAERSLIPLNGAVPGAAAKTVEGRVVAMGADERLILLRDVTTQQRLNDELARARDAAEAAAQAKSTFLATMSHEIRTPLNAVIGMAAMLETTELTAAQRKYVAIITNGGQSLLAVINNILDFSRIEAGHMELENQPFDLHDCLTTTVDLVRHEARRKDLHIECRVTNAVPRAVIGDTGRLRQVVLNLLANAIKFTDAGAVYLEAGAGTQTIHRTTVTIQIRDTGIGMTPEQLARVFDPFIQGDRSIARRFGGTGLGLAISRQLVGLMGGRLDVRSTPNQGSTFTITLPFVIASEADLPQPGTVLQPAAIPLRILVAEDNPINQDVIRSLLEQVGHSVTIVGDGQAAVEAVQLVRYDVVLMDVQMPILDGETATRRIRQLGGGIAQPPIIALTAHALADDRTRFLECGMNGYLSKPVQPAALQRVLVEVAGAMPTGAAAAVVQPLPPESVSLIDWDEVRHLARALNMSQANVLGTVLEIFEETIPAQLDAIDAAIDSGDVDGCQLAAHRLRGGCLQIGAQAMADLCRRLEHSDNSGDFPALIAALHTCYSQTYALLRKHSVAAE